MRETHMGAGEFKAKCLALIDRVGRTGQPLVITKRGKPVAQVVPVSSHKAHRSVRGSVISEHDIVSPIDAAWDAEK